VDKTNEVQALAGARLAVSAKELAELLGVSQRHVWRLLAMGRLPKPFRLGRAVRWNYALCKSWADAGCPPVERFQTARAAP